LNGIIGSIEILLNSDLTPEQQEYVNLIMFSSRNLLSLINNLFDLSMIESGRLELQLQPMFLITTINEAVSILKPLAQMKKIDLLFENNSTYNEEIMGDKLKLWQVLVNLTYNGIKFTNAGSVKLTLDQRSLDDDKVEATVSVEDTGIGVPLEDQPKLFDEFFQSSISASRGGAGLGLVVCKRLLDLMGDGLGFSSQQNIGTCFWFRLMFTKPRRITSVAKEETRET